MTQIVRLTLSDGSIVHDLHVTTDVGNITIAMAMRNADTALELEQLIAQNVVSIEAV